MPVTVELMVLMLLTYALGVAIGWGLWGAKIPTPDETATGTNSENDS